MKLKNNPSFNKQGKNDSVTDQCDEINNLLCPVWQLLASSLQWRMKIWKYFFLVLVFTLLHYWCPYIQTIFSLSLGSYTELNCWVCTSWEVEVACHIACLWGGSKANGKTGQWKAFRVICLIENPYGLARLFV